MDKKIIEELVNRYGDELDDGRFDNIVYSALEKNAYDDLMSVFSSADISVPSAVTALPYSFHLDTMQMPSYLRSAHFVAWLKKFNQLIKKIGLPELRYSTLDVTVEFSDKKKIKRYGVVTLEEFKRHIRDTYGKHKAVEDILSGIKNKEDCRKAMKDLVSLLRRICPSDDLHDPEELYSYLKDLELEVNVLGEYIHKDKLIILYTANIEAAAVEHCNSPSREFERVFIHELFHAYHYISDRDELVNRSDYTSAVVKESLASAFECCYCEENGINGADALRSSWLYNSVLFYPYSGAINLYPTTVGTSILHRLDYKKFARIFNESLNDVDKALRDLLEPYEFFDIKNSRQVRERFVKRFISSTDLRSAFDELMKKDKISVIAQREIPSVIRQAKNRNLIPELLDQGYSYANFHMTQYPVLSTAPMYDKAGRLKSYADPVLRIGKTNYYMSAQWNDRYIDLLLDWIWANR